MSLDSCNDFTIVHQKGSANTNADALSRLAPPSCALTVALPHYSLPELEKAQMLDPIISVIHKARLQSCDEPHDTAWNQGTLRRYKMLWKQLVVVDGVLYRMYHPGPSEEAITVPILPSLFHQEALTISHDIPTAGHLGIEKPYIDCARMCLYHTS